MAWNTLIGADREKWTNSKCTLVEKPTELVQKLDERVEEKKRFKNDSKSINAMLSSTIS